MKKTEMSSILVAMLELHLAGVAHARQPGRIARLGYVATSLPSLAVPDGLADC